MPNNYATYRDIEDHMPDVGWDASYEPVLTKLAERASRLIDDFLKREPGAFYVSTDTTRYFTGSGDAELWIGELAAAPTSLAVAETGTTTYTTWAATDYILWPYNALLEGLPYQRLDVDEVNGTKEYWVRYPKAVKIVGKFGFATAIPEEIKEACVIQAVRWFKRSQQAFQDTAAIIELGQLRYTQRIDPDIQTILESPKFRRVTI
jgi:hypothetical protein